MHRPGLTRRVAVFELEAIALPSQGHKQIQFRTAVSAPEVGVARCQQADHLLESEPFPRFAKFGMCLHGVATASVFTLVAFLIGLRSVLPQVDYLTRLDELVLSVTALVFLALGESVVTTRLAMRQHYDAAVRIEGISRWIYLSLLVALLVIHLTL